MSTLQILHISDLHINTKENFDRSVVLDPLIKRVEADIGKDLRPEIVIVTGDIADTGIKPEYDLAKEFFDKLLSTLEISNDRLFIVPGNHDVDRSKYRPTDIPSYDNVKKLNDELEDEEYRKDLFKGMEDYFKFTSTHYPHLKSKHGSLIPFVSSYDSNSGKKIGFVGLNSAWMCRKSPDKEEIAVGEYQIKKAMEELGEMETFGHIINIFHHPLNWLWADDRMICKKYFNNTILLYGHLHETEGGYHDDLDGSLFQFQAGGAYVGSGSKYPNRYQYITFDWNKDEIILNFRRFDKESRKWCIDAEKGDDGERTFMLKKLKETLKQPEPVVSDVNEVEDIIPHSIPMPSNIFTGRNDDLKRFKEALGKSNLISIEGMGGIGKTEFATKCIEEYAQQSKAVWFDCFPDTKLDSVIDYCGYSDVIQGENKTELAKYSGFLSLVERDEKIIFLDNYQDIMDESFRNFFKFSERRMRKARFVMIAREHPALGSIHILPVTLEGLKKYSVEYARRVINMFYSDVVVDDDSLQNICDTVDGHPLAIDLAIQLLHYGEASREIIDKLVHSKDINEELSHRLLDEIFNHPKSTVQEKEFLLNFSIFRNKVFQKAFEHISGDPDRMSILHKLMDKHMIMRYGNLYGAHPLVREFCYHRLENKEKLHHKAYEYLKSIRQERLDIILEEEVFYHLSNGEQSQELVSLISEKGEDFILLGHTNFLKEMMDRIMEKGIEQAVFYLYYGDIAQIRGEWDDAKKNFEKAFSFPNVDERTNAMAYIKYGEMLYRKGNVKESLRYFEDGEDICKKIGFEKGEARSLNNIGFVLNKWGDLDGAMSKFKEGLKISEDIGDKSGIATTLNNIGHVLDNRGDSDGAMSKHKESLKIGKDIGDKSGIAICLNNIGLVLDKRGDLDGAMSKFKESLKICVDVGDKSGIASTLHNIGLILNKRGDSDDAMSKFKESLKITEDIGDKSGIAFTLNCIGSILHKRGDLDGAMSKHKESLKIREEIGDKEGIANSLHNIGTSYFDNKNYHFALINLFKSMALDNQMRIKKQLTYDYISKIRKIQGFKKFKDLAEETHNNLPEDLKSFIDIKEFTDDKTIHVTEKPRRNAPCPCGSGKKYKQCCGRS